MADGNRKKITPTVNGKTENDCKITEKEPIAPDGGFGWVVVTASFFAMLIMDGNSIAFGIFYLEFLDNFQEGRSKTAWIGSVINGIYMVTAPLTGACANKFGCRRVAMVGAMCASFAFFGSTFSRNVDTLIITYGVLGGIGFGMMYLPAIVMVGFYFDKRRALATGIATCGSGIGGFIFAPLCEELIQYYGWRGAQWIIAGIVLNGALLGALYRPLTEKDIDECKLKWRKKHNIDTASLERNRDVNKLNTGSLETNSDSDKLNTASLETNRNSYKLKNASLEAKRYSHKLNSTSLEAKRDSHKLNSTSLEAKRDSHKLNSTSLGTNRDSHTLNTASLDVHKFGSVGNLAPDIEKLAETKDVPRWKQILHNLAETMDITVLKLAVFDIYGLSCIFCMIGYFVPLTYLPDLCLSLGYSKYQGAFLLSIMGIANSVGRILAGWLSDRTWADCLLINNIALIIGGVATILCPFCKTYVLLCVYSSVFGLCIAAFVTLRSIILIDFIGITRLTSSFGIIVLCQGISSFIGTPLAGWLYDVTETYDLSFYVAGSSIAMAGIIALPLRRIAKCQDTQKYYVDSTITTIA